jgi:hypothetical protein
VLLGFYVDAHKADAAVTLAATFTTSAAAAAAAGEVCLFTQIEWLREQLQQWQEAAAEQQQLAEALQASLAVAGSSSDSDAGSDGADFEDLDDSLHDLPESSGRVSVT